MSCEKNILNTFVCVCVDADDNRLYDLTLILTAVFHLCTDNVYEKFQVFMVMYKIKSSRSLPFIDTHLKIYLFL
jgi:hypothetical protein